MSSVVCFLIKWQIGESDYDITANCVVPENIHTPNTEGISYRTPPPLRIFHFGVAVVAPPPLWNFQRIFYHPLYPWKYIKTFHHPDFWPLYFSELEVLNHFGGVMHLCNISIL